MSRLEARRWLNRNKNKHAFAGNRFADNKETLQFVENLYENGAIEVIVDNIFKERWRIKENGGPYADTLIVLVPQDNVQKEKLIQISRNEYNLSSAGFEDVIDDEHTVMILWWD